MKSCDILTERARGDHLGGMLYQMNAEGKLRQIESPFHILRNKEVCETSGPIDNELSKMFEVHVFSDSVPCLGKSVMASPEIKFTERWKEHLEYYKDTRKEN